MERIDLTAEQCRLIPEEKIKKIIKDFFKDTPYEIRSLFYYTCKVELNLTYENFVPEYVVKEHLERQIPALELTLERTYSKSVTDDVIEHMREEFVDVWMYDRDNHLCKVNLHQLLDAWLSDKEVHKGQVMHGRYIEAK